MLLRGILAFVLSALALAARGEPTPDVLALAAEVKDKGWIVFAARGQQGDWDLLAARPDGSAVRHLTRTPDTHEFAPQFSRDGKRLLFRRTPKSERIESNRFGAQGELVLADADGGNAVALGKAGEFPWASWSPDGSQLACLSLKGIEIIDVASQRVVRTLPRKGFFQQMTWSPDGKALVGVSNSFGTGWAIARMDLKTGEAAAASRVDCCTPDWFPSSTRIVFSHRFDELKHKDGKSWTQLWAADADGKNRALLYAEDGRHIYGGHISPDGKYVLFTGNMNEDGDAENAGAPMALMRLGDAPIVGGDSAALRKLYPGAKSGPVLTLPRGWEPCWTARDIFPREAGQK